MIEAQTFIKEEHQLKMEILRLQKEDSEIQIEKNKLEIQLLKKQLN